MYAKIFSSIYDGTLRADWKALITFQQLLILSDCDDDVDMTADAISGRTGIPIDIIIEGLKTLETPDPVSRSSKEEGRRIVLLDPGRSWGWHIVNRDAYKRIGNYEDKKKRERERISEKRKEIKDVAKRCQVLPSVANVAQAVGSRQETEDKRSSKDRKRDTLALFGEFKKVQLTQYQFENLAERLGQETRDQLIIELDGAVEGKGYKYKSAYATILNWDRIHKKKEPDYGKVD